MRPVTDEKASGISLKRFLIAGALAGIVAAVLNNIYAWAYKAITGYPYDVVINVATVTLASIVPLILAGFVYYLLATNTSKPTVYFVIMTIFLTVVSIASMAVPKFPDREAVPEGFYALAIPMHFIAGGIAALLIPLYVTKGKKHENKEHA